MSKFPAVLLASSIVVAALVSVLCVILLPSGSSGSRYRYVIKENGKVVWLDNKTGKEKLQVTSSALAESNGELSTAERKCENGATLTELKQFPNGQAQCWKISSCLYGVASSQQHLLEDCIAMQTESLDTVHWMGGAEMITQKWPLNDIRLEQGAPFLSTDLPKRYGNVLERYYISSLGAAVFVDPEVPLHVSIYPNQRLCLSASYEDSRFVGPGYVPEHQQTNTTLSYTVCMSEDSKTAHAAMTDIEYGFISRPTELPDVKMMQDPIWSTWARFKRDINQTIVEAFAEEILVNNFTYCQLEVDDGYETSYGDFTFDNKKFPNPENMIANLHEMGFRVTIWVTPFINLDSENYKYGRANNYFVPESDDGKPAVIRWWNGRGSTVDFTNSNASTWYGTILESTKQRYELDSFKFDAGETSYLPKAGLNYTANRYTNPSDYTTHYAKTAFKVGGHMMEMRSSWKTQSGAFFMRLMDKGSSWGSLRGFRTVIPTALTFGIIGYPFVLPDMIGGNAYGINFTMPERELFIRWIELSAFLPCMQFSISPWQYDDEVTDIARYYTNLHRTIVYEEVVAAAQRYVNGQMSLPVAPIWFHAAYGDTIAFTVDDQFMVGDRYLVAPILQQGVSHRDIYFPGAATVYWRDRMRKECDDTPTTAINCTVNGGMWLMSYQIALDQISWWEKLPK